LAKKFGMSAVALTDHGNMFGAIEFYQGAIKHGIKPIVGCEVYVAPGSRLEKKPIAGTEGAYHLTLLVKNRTGYFNLANWPGHLLDFKAQSIRDSSQRSGLIALAGV
jgi:DNA polymerase-3 subunit alpha